MSESFTGGFAAPVFDAQATFRAVLDAVARPGRIVPLRPRSRPPKPLPPLAGDILVALADPDTGVWLAPPLAAAAWLRFHTGAPACPAAGADFVVAAAADLPPLAGLATGTADYPDRSATVLVLVTALDSGTPVRLTGPGVDGSRRFAPAGLPAGFWAQAVANHALYPRGVDLLFVAPDAIAALPRSTAIHLGTEA